MRKAFLPLFLILFLFSVPFMISQCGGGSAGGGGGDTTPTPGPTPTAAPTVELEEFIGDARLCEPGDIAKVPFSGNSARFTLNKESCEAPNEKDNREEEYTLILYNTSANDAGFTIESPENIEPFQEVSAKLLKTSSDPDPINEISDVKKQAYLDYLNLKENDPRLLEQKISKTDPSLKGAFVVGDEVSYRVRSDYNDEDVYNTSSAIFRHSGEHCELWVDRMVPYEDASGDYLTLAQLQDIADVFDNNIHPLVTTLLGTNCSSFPDSNCPLSDMDGNSKIKIIISPVMNWISSTADDADDNAEQVIAYSDTRDMLALGSSSPMANEGETIYIHAPDPDGEFNEDYFLPASYYVSKELFAWITVMLTRILSYNMHVFINNSSPEVGWIDYGMGGLLADLAGFNIWTTAAWWWLDAPGYESIYSYADFPQTLAMGAPYLFLSYLMQSQVDKTINATIDDGTGVGLIDEDLDFLAVLMSALTGVDNLENAIELEFDEEEETEFQILFKNWTVALVTGGTGRFSIQSDPDFLYYRVRSSGNDTSMPIPDSRLYGPGIATWYAGTSEWASSRIGARGNPADAADLGNASPVGIDLNNYNLYWNSIYPDLVDLIENPHEFTYTPGQRLYGVVKPSTAAFVRIGGLFEQVTDVAVFADNPVLNAFIVRLPNLPVDAGGTPRPRIYAESKFGPLPQMPEDLGTPGANPLWPVKLDYPYYAGTAGSVGGKLTVVGKIDEPEGIWVCNHEDCICTKQDVPDFDKYLIQIPAAPADAYNLAVWVEAQASGVSGTSELDPLLSIVSWDDVPYPYGRPNYAALDPDGAKTSDRPKYRHVYEKDGLKQDVPRPDGIAQCVPGTNGYVTGGNDNTPAFPGGFDDLPVSLADASDGILGACGFDNLASLGHDSSQYGTPWTSLFPLAMYNREILLPDSTDPIAAGYKGSEVDYDPRSISAFTLDCVDPIDDPPDANTPDDFLQEGELSKPGNFQEQILAEMSRDPYTNGYPDPGVDPDLPYDTLVMAPDSLAKSLMWGWVEEDDGDWHGLWADLGNNTGGRSVSGTENASIFACVNAAPRAYCDTNSIHVYENRQYPTDEVYPADLYLEDPVNNPFIYLEPGKYYVIMVAGQNGSTGRYELNLRKILPNKMKRADITIDGRALAHLWDSN